MKEQKIRRKIGEARRRKKKKVIKNIKRSKRIRRREFGAKLTGVLDVYGRRRVGSRDVERRRHLGVQGGEARVCYVVDEIGAVVSARTAHFQFILTRHHRHFRPPSTHMRPLFSRRASFQ